MHSIHNVAIENKAPTVDLDGIRTKVLAAHGGAERWESVVGIRASGRLSGLLPGRFAGTKLANFCVRVRVDEQRTVWDEFPQVGMRGVFDRGEVRIETHNGEILASRTEPRSAFSGLSGIRRNFHWDALDTTYFAGYAMWNYLTAPLLLTGNGVTVSDGGAWQGAGQAGRRLLVTFPAGMHSHCRNQVFYVDSRGRIPRHDFVAEPVGRWARAAICSEGYREFDGLVVPARRRVVPRGPAGRLLPWPTLLALDFDHIEVERSDAGHEGRGR